MLVRLFRSRPPRGLALDVLNLASLFVVVSGCLAIIAISTDHIGQHFHVLRDDPLSAFVTGPRQLDAATKAEAGIAPPAPVAGPLPAATTDPLPSPRTYSPLEQMDAPPVPTLYQLKYPTRGQTWLPIVMYHYVRKVSRRDALGWNLSVTPDNFRAQVQWLADNGYTTITMHDADLMLAGKKPIPDKVVALTFDDGYRDFYTTAAPILRTAGFTATNYIPTGLVGGDNYMTWDEVEELDAQGFEMADHTISHADLSKATTDRARVEIFGSKADLEDHLGHPVVDFAYPYGAVSVAVARLVRDAGFWSATTTQPGAWHDAAGMLYLTRVRMGGTQGGADALAAGITEPTGQFGDIRTVRSAPTPRR